jgi:predicted RNA binding protein YcfA (HicA-like mRNA interferase family)
VDHVKGSHVVLYHPESKKRTTVPKHSNKKDLSEGTLLAILRQTGFTKKELSQNI